MFDAMTDADDFGLRYHKAMLRIFGGISVLGNVAYGFVSEAGTLPSVFTALVSAIFPLTLMAASDDLVVLARHCTGAVRAAMMAMAAATAVLMFIVSFDALSGLFMLAGKGEAVAKCGAIAIDLFVVQASISALWASNKVRAAEESRMIQAPIDQASHVDELVDDDADEPAIHPDDPVDDDLIDQPIQPVDDDRNPAIQAPIDQAIHRDDPVDDVVDCADESQVKTAIHPVIHSGDPVDDDADDPVIHTVDDDLIDQAIHPGDPVDDDADDPAIHSAIHSVDDGLDRLAGQVREALGTEADRETIRRALALDREGLSRRRIAEEVGAAHSTVGRWIKAAERAEGSQRQLVAVD